MTARKIIERRLGKPLPPTRELRPYERQAVKLLAIELIKAKARKAT